MTEIKGGRPPSTRADRLVPAALILLIAIPVVAGIVRLTQLAVGVEITPSNARFFASPVPVVAHIVGVIVYGVLGAFQFAPGFRRRNPAWHRKAGRVLIVCGLVVALSALWMTLFYPRPDDVGDLLSGIRLVVGSAMAASIVLGFAAIRRRDFARHRAWMIRAYALGMGAGTQALTQLPWILTAGPPGRPDKAVLMAAAWLINVLVAEWIIRTGERPRRLRIPARASGP
ncbi:putative membrane protein [Actinocorallia herbida]|uniref:Putative membrane protein n=1 Tax=Actinocorallia herbida TaxID=58109 RepID=A0A3N1D043_9ACTN|nr:DUF2306 domain-containing protein [Actinocorallia herbida]ROO86899.1 putative membrane protein [Actinocorallia herbida]